KVALVTGGAGGIGRAIIDTLAAAGACVVAFDLDEAGAAEAVAGYGDRGLAIAGDVTRQAAVPAALDAAVQHVGRGDPVNPDAVLQGSKIWGSSWREERAGAYNLEPDELDEHYRKRTTLGVSILPEDIAEAVLHFASERRSGKSTGNMLNVDGGVPAAY